MLRPANRCAVKCRSIEREEPFIQFYFNDVKSTRALKYTLKTLKLRRNHSLRRI